MSSPQASTAQPGRVEQLQMVARTLFIIEIVAVAVATMFGLALASLALLGFGVIGRAASHNVLTPFLLAIGIAGIVVILLCAGLCVLLCISAATMYKSLWAFWCVFGFQALLVLSQTWQLMNALLTHTYIAFWALPLDLYAIAVFVLLLVLARQRTRVTK